MLVQLHMQNNERPNETDWIMQGEVNCYEDITEWWAKCRIRAMEIHGDYQEHWLPIICDENSEYFCKTLDQSQGGG